MGKGQKTKAGHILQMIYHGANPNLFNPAGKRVVCHNAEDYDFIEGIEFDKLGRKGAKALVANVPLEEMWTGKISGPLHYNLMDDQVFPFWIAKGTETPITVNGVPCIDTEYVRPQLDRADRAFFSIEEGKAGGSADLGCYGLFTSFKWTSKRGNKGTSRMEIGFTTQAAVRRPALTGGAAQNHKVRVTAVNVAGPVGLSIVVPGVAAAKAVSLAIGDTVAAMVAKFAAVDLAVAITGTIAAGNGEAHALIATNAVANATIYGTVNVTPGMATAALETAIKAKGGLYANASVSGGTNAFVAGIANPTNAPTVAGSAGGGFVSGTYLIGYTYLDANGKETGLSPLLTLTRPNGETYNISVGALPAGAASFRAYISSPGGNASTLRLLPASQNTSATNFNIGSQDPAGALAPTSNATQTPSNGTYIISFPASVGDVPDITSTPGTNWTTNDTQPGAAGGMVDIEFTRPSNTLLTVSKASGDAGYALSTPQYGGDGGILTAMKEEDPINPGHLFLYSSDTAAGLDDEANLVGQIGEWELDDSKICLPVSHHVRVVDPERPTLPTTYNAHAEEESQTDGIKLNVTMDAGEDGSVADTMRALLRASGTRLVSAPRYWRIAAIHPGDSPRRVFVDYYGSIGASAPVKWAGSVEQYTFAFDLLENREGPWNFRAKTRRPA